MLLPPSSVPVETINVITFLDFHIPAAHQKHDREQVYVVAFRMWEAAKALSHRVTVRLVDFDREPVEGIVTLDVFPGEEDCINKLARDLCMYGWINGEWAE